MLPNAEMPHKKHLWQIFHLIAWILRALIYTAELNHSRSSVGWLQRPTSSALSLEFLIVIGNRTPWRVNYFESPACCLLIPVHPSDGDHELLEFLPCVRPLDNLSWATFFSFHCGGVAARTNVRIAQNERERSQ